MAVETLENYGHSILPNYVPPTVLAVKCSDDVVRVPLADPATGALPVAIASGGGDASAAKQDVGNASLASIDGKTPTLVSGRQPVVLQTALPAGTNVIGQTGYKLVKVSANFTRPADTTAYAVGDAVTNSTSSPTVFQLDLGALGAVAGQGIEIRKLAVVSSAKQATLPLFNVYLNNATFTATNDNAALDIPDATMEQGGSWFACDVQNFTASNSRVAYVNIASPMVLAAADTKLYGIIQAANAYTPVSGEKFTIVAWVALL